MSETIRANPQKVHLLNADAAEVEVEDILHAPAVEIDMDRRSISVVAEGHNESGEMSELIASARGLKVACGSEGGARRSLHLAFERPEDLDELVSRLEAGGVTVVRSDLDPEVKTYG
jgi:hypothetical protein